MPDEKQIEYMVFPRILALSEVVWSPTENKNYPGFLNRVENFHKRLKALNINYANHLYDINGQLLSENGKLSYQLTTASANKTIRFTTDNSEPRILSDSYNSPIIIEKNTIIKAAVFDNETQLSKTFIQELTYHKAVGKSITLSVEPHKAYNAGGKEALINSINGSDTRFGDKEWLGFYGDDVTITIDLGEEMEINSIETRFFNAPGQWIYGPKSIELGFDDHGINSKYELPTNDNRIIPLKILPNSTSRKIYLKFNNYGIIPDGKQGAGNKAWLFIDEIIVN
jgi:hexosaminidase